jgi:2,4-dienoyl-CoA reductase-like NADH-dependent reductase (Old Yellow Enzyme family)
VTAPVTAAHLFTPLTLRDITFPHRVVVSPMCQYSSADGFASDWHLVHLGSRAVGGAAAVLTEATAVAADGRISPDDLGIWKHDHVEMLGRIFRFVESQGAVPGMQLAHAGRKASTAAPFKGGKPLAPDQGGWTPIVGPSAIAFDEGYQTPHALDAPAIAAVVRAFADAAGRALEAGARVVEIHGAHGYLLHSFLSPLSNRRTDAYGGSFDNRTRLVREVIAAIRRVWPDRLPLFLRLSSTDWADGGWTIDDSVALARQAASLGVDAIDCSSGGLVPRVSIPMGAGYQVPFAERIRREAGVPTIAVGLISGVEQADHIVRTGQADLVMMAREFLRQPYWPIHAARQLKQDVRKPPQYLRAY